MTDESYERKVAELDDLLNDPNMPFYPARVWQLLGEISGHFRGTNTDKERWPVGGE